MTKRSTTKYQNLNKTLDTHQQSKQLIKSSLKLNIINKDN